MKRLLPVALLVHWLMGGVEAAPAEIIVASYNVENYLGPRAEGEGGARAAQPKSEKAMEAVANIIKEINPDILGVCEMGWPEQFEAFKQRLEHLDLGYRHFEYVNGPDPDRHLALLSRFPIVARQSPATVQYEMDGLPQTVKRGFLDVTVRVAAGYELRLVGAHLKSKLEVPEGAALVRRHEAHALRQHIDAILQWAPQTNLLVYGDFNELKNEPAIQEITGPRGSPGHLTDLAVRDVEGDRWTQYWRAADLYSRIDYFFASPALSHEIVMAHSGIYRSPMWNQASDHRPIFASILPVNRR